MSTGSTLPTHPFFASPEQRVALARQRYFDEGVRPSGLVSEAVLQSWSRCLRGRADPTRPAVFEPVTPSRVHGVLRANRELLEAAADELERLRQTLAGTSSTAMLTDAHGVMIGSTFTQARSHERLMPVSTRLGVNLAEEAVGTTAPGITARTGQPSVVLGGEHFFGNVQVMHCAAAPIRDVRGRLAGVLDLSSEGLPFGFDAATVVSHYAAEIENRLLCAQSTEHLVVRLQIAPALLDTPLAALLGVTGDGRIDWLNGAATRLLGLAVPAPHLSGLGPAEDHLGLSLDALADLALRQEPRPVQLPSGLMVWLRCECRARDGRDHLHPAASVDRSATSSAAAGTPPAHSATDSAGATGAARAATLRDTEHQTIARVLGECGGNVSQAARALGVSRGRIYRHLRQAAGHSDG